MLFSAGDLERVIGARLLRGERVEFGGVACDSREAKPGDLFVALPGERTDGHLHVPDAARRGAAGALVARPIPTDGLPPAFALWQVEDPLAALGRLARHHLERHAAPVVGVTGSVGKTTTRDWCAAACSPLGPVLRSEGNYNTEVGLPLTLFRLRPQHRVVVLEMGMRGRGQIARLCRIAPPRVGIVTVIGEAHLALLGSREEIARAKGELVEALPPAGAAVLNVDDPWQRGLAARSPAPVLWYGEGRGAEVRAEEVEEDGAGQSFRLRSPWGEVRLSLPAYGPHGRSDVLAACAAALWLGVRPEALPAALAGAELTGGRSEVIRLARGVLIDDSYNASPTSVRAGLRLLDALGRREGGRRVAVLGEMLELGASERDEHEAIGREAARCCDLLVTVGPLAEGIRNGAAEGWGDPSPERLTHRPDADAALVWLLPRLVPGDVVLVKGSRAVGLDRVARGLREALGGGGGR